MSKEAATRAMREARYAEQTTRSAAARRAAPTSPAPTSPTPTRPAPTAPAAKERAGTPADPAAADGLCGHRSMNGRTCTRESGHAAKSHRYS